MGTQSFAHAFELDEIIALKHCMIRARFCARELTTAMEEHETLFDKRMKGGQELTERAVAGARLA